MIEREKSNIVYSIYLEQGRGQGSVVEAVVLRGEKRRAYNPLLWFLQGLCFIKFGPLQAIVIGALMFQ